MGDRTFNNEPDLQLPIGGKRILGGESDPEIAIGLGTMVFGYEYGTDAGGGWLKGGTDPISEVNQYAVPE
ncbi:MAG: hypothetical protein IPO87_06570 [Flavobacteriales bacterium]|nr:hypothetical protein [Flavobacteriales bacterium]